MTDITMCKGGGCERKERCYRYMAEPNYLAQSCFVDKHPCGYRYEYFMPMRGKKEEEKP